MSDFLKKSLVSNSIIYMITSIINSGLPFLLLPILTAYLTPDEYGNLGIFQAFFTAFLPLIGLGTSGAIIRKSYDISKSEIGVYIFNVVLISLVGLLFISILIYLFREWIIDLLNFKIQWIFYSLFYAFGMFLINILLGQFQVQEKPVKYGIFQVLNAGLNLSLSLIFVIFLLWGEEGRILGMFLSSIVFSILAVCILKKSGRLIASYNVKYIKNALQFGLPLLPHELGTFLMNWVSIFIINAFLNKTSVGIYIFAFQISMILGIFCDAFNRAFVPWLYTRLKKNNYNEKLEIVNITYIYFILMIVISIVSFKMLPLIIEGFFDASYKDAGKLVGWLILGQAFGGMYLMVTNYIFYSEKTAILSIISVSISIIGLIIMYLLVKYYGLIGSAISFVIMKFSLFIITWYVSNNKVHMPWRLQKK